MQLADRILTKLGLSALDLLHESDLDAALRKKMAEWDRQMALNGDGHYSDFDADALMITPRKPAVRSSVKYESSEKTG